MNWEYGKGRIYSIDNIGELIAETSFICINEDEVDINYTYVNLELRGRGIASEMMAAVAIYLRDSCLKATASCSYAYDWFKRNETVYPDVISKDMNDKPIACRVDGKY